MFSTELNKLMSILIYTENIPNVFLYDNSRPKKFEMNIKIPESDKSIPIDSIDNIKIKKNKNIIWFKIPKTTRNFYGKILRKNRSW